MNRPYFYTWTDQNNATSFKVKDVTRDYYLLEDNTKLYDLTSCSYHQCLGLKNDNLATHLTTQLHTLPLAGPKIDTDLKINATNKLLKLLKINEGKIFYTTSGSESVENALKFARLSSGKDIILSRKVSYHGATTGSLTATGDWRRDDHKTLDDHHHFIAEPTNKNYKVEIEKLLKSIDTSNIAAIILETITGGNGVIIPHDDYYQYIRSICDKYEIALIFDEVVCGFGRTGKNFGFHHYTIKPDMICMAKGISAGFIPFGALWVNQKLSTYFDTNKLSMGLTNYAHPMGLSALDFMCDYLENNENIKKISALTNLIEQELISISNLDLVIDTRQIGLLAAIELKTPIDSKKFYEAGVYTVVTGNNIILCPHFEYEESTLKELLKRISSIIKGES